MKSFFRNHCAYVLFGIFYALPALFASAQSTPVTIMPLGDSITAGVDGGITATTGGYRDPLYSDLTAAGVSFTFVGANNNTNHNGSATRQLNAANQASHNGFGGWWIQDLDNNLNGVAAPTTGGDSNQGGYLFTGGNGTGRNAVSPNIVLLQVGANDVIHGNSLANMETAIVKLVQDIHTLSPGSTIIIAAIPPTSSSGFTSTIQSYNQYIQNSVVPTYSYTRFVDNFTAFTSGGVAIPALVGGTSATGGDGVHPTRYGYAIMAAHWAAGIESLLNVTPATYTLSVSGGTINNGASSGSYAPGSLVTLISTVSSFGSWSGNTFPATVGLENPFSSISTFIMPQGNATVTANTSSSGILIPNGTYYLIGASDEYRMGWSAGPGGLPATAAGSTTGSLVDIQTLTGAALQKWVVTNTSNNQIELAPSGTGLALEPQAGSTTNGAAVDVETYNSTNTAQLWTVSPLYGSTELINVASGIALYINPYTLQLAQDDASVNPPVSGGQYAGQQAFSFYPAPANPPPNPPTSLSASTSVSGQVTLSWAASSGATSYTIYRGTTGAGLANLAVVATGVTSTSYTDKALTGPPPAPTGLTPNTNTPGQVGLTWSAGGSGTNNTTYNYEVVAVGSGGASGSSNDVTATPSGGPAVTSYNVYRTTGQYDYYLYSTPIANGVTTTSFTDTTVTTTGPYYYTVTAVSTTGIGPGSNQATASPTLGGSAPSITSATTASGTVGTAFSYQITATNSPTSYSATGLPTGLSVNTSTGAITGTPTAAGTSTIAIGATNSSGTGSATLTLTVAAAGSPPSITSATTASGTAGTAFNYQITASNNPTSYSATGLPAGLSVNTGTGAISGTPTSAGTSTVTIGATNSIGTGTATLTLTIAAAAAPPSITSSTTASGTVGTAFSYQITASNTPTSFNATGLPGGLSVSTSTGAITGTPTAAGTSSVTISATNASGTGSATLTLTVSAAGTQQSIGLQFVGQGTALAAGTSAGVPAVAQTNWQPLTGSSFSSVTLNNNAGTATTAKISGGADGTYFSGSSFPAGGNQTLCSGELYDGNITTETNSITISSIPYAQYDVYVYGACDAGGRNATFTVTPSGGSASSLSFQTESNGSTWTAGTNTWNGSGTAPSLSVGNYVHFTGLTASSFNLKFGGVGNVGMNGIQIVSTGSTVSAPSITSSTTASGTVGSAFSYQITASNSPTSYSATGLPGGLSVNTSTGAITGTPTAAGTSSVTIGATNASGTGTATLTLTIAAASNPPAITSSTSASGTVGTAFSYQITASNSPTSYSATGLPSGLSINTSTGAITGTPTATGTSSVTIGATNASGTGTATLSLTIAASGTTTVVSVQFPQYYANGIVNPMNNANNYTGGVVPVQNWNVADTNTGTSPASNASLVNSSGAPLGSSILVNSTGANTAIGFTYSGYTNNDSTNNSSFPSPIWYQAGGLTDAFIAGGTSFNETGASETLAVTGLSASSTYNLIVYVTSPWWDNSGSNPASVSLGGTTKYIETSNTLGVWTQATSTTSGSPTTGNYVEFTNLTGSTTQTVTVTGAYVGLAGFQIVATGSSGGSAPAITSATTASGTAGTAFSYQITASNSPTSYSATGLPSGLSVNTSTGAITGTPSAAGTSSVTVGATNSSGTGTATLTLTVAAASNPPSITSSTSASGTVGTAFSYQITATNSPTSYSATGLPGGLSVNTSTGAITGTPTAAGTSSVTIGATNASGTGTATLTLTVSAAGAQQSIALQFVGSGTAMSSTDSAGVPAVAQTNWQTLSGSTFTNVSLTSNTGGSTTAILNGSADGTYFCGSAFTSGTGNAKLCSGELFDGNINTETNSITISSIPYAQYDVYIYGECDAAGRNATFTVTPSGGSASSLSFQTQSNGSTWTAGTNTWNGSGTAPSLAVGNYVHFTGLTASSFNLKFGGVGNVSINGIQIVKTGP